MDKYFIDNHGRAEARTHGSEERKHVKFPLCLAIKHGDSVPIECADFLLNIRKKMLFVSTGLPLPPGAKLMLHFYIPPKNKLLAELKGRVIKETEINNVRGSMIKISDFLHRRLNRLEQYLEEKRHLVNEKA